MNEDVSSPAFCRPGIATTRRHLLAMGVAGIGTLGGCAWLDARQRVIVYRPSPGTPAGFPGLRPGDEAFDVPIAATRGTRLLDGSPVEVGTPQQVRLWWLPQANPAAPALLYLHGTFRNLYQNLAKIDALREVGVAVLAVEYRGWGSSTPIVPSEQSIYADAALGWAELAKRQPDPRRRVIFGHSMGGGVAVELASTLRHATDYAALILESTFTRMPDVARGAGALAGALAAALSSQRFDSVDKISRVDAPLLVLHGTADNTVPFELGLALFEAAREPKRFVAIEGGSHSHLQRDAPLAYRAALRDLLRSLP